MTREAFATALDHPFPADDRGPAFHAAISALREDGAVITSEGEQVLAFIRTLGESERGLKISANLFTKNATPRAVLRDATARMKAHAKSHGMSNNLAGHTEAEETPT
jgi:hypothetical protein